jgi:hypothetical protein
VNVRYEEGTANRFGSDSHLRTSGRCCRSGAVKKDRCVCEHCPGNRILADRIGSSVLEAVEHKPGTNGMQQKLLPFGAFSFNRRNSDLLNAVTRKLRSYLGSLDHRARMARFGLTHNEIDRALAR